MNNSDNKIKEDNDLFYFESDHLALRGNKDYSDLLKTMFILEAQREQAIKNYNQVSEIKQQSLEDPISCIEKLKTGNLEIPDMQCIADIPHINWTKYNIKIPEQYIKQINEDRLEPHKESKHDHKDRHNSKPWTTEEQRKLEELLIKFPPEDTESKRIKKIANELGTRTSKQVASRLQKYYLKLLKAGLPIPGPLPKNKGYDKRNLSKKQRYQYNIKPSTFFPELDIPVVMNESEHAPGPSNSKMSEITTANIANYLLSNSYHENKQTDNVKTDMELQVELLKRIKMEKLNEESDLSQPFQHYGYKCDYCEEEPVEGSRWHCSSCSKDSVDFCTDCMLTQTYSNNPHSLQHKFIIIRNDKMILNAHDSDSESMTGSSMKNGDNNSSDESESEYSKTEICYESEVDDLCNKNTSNQENFTFSVNNDFNFQISESCPSNIFETKDNVYVNGTNFTETQKVSYDYLHSNLLIEDS